MYAELRIKREECENLPLHAGRAVLRMGRMPEGVYEGIATTLTVPCSVVMLQALQRSKRYITASACMRREMQMRAWMPLYASARDYAETTTGGEHLQSYQTASQTPAPTFFRAVGFKRVTSPASRTDPTSLRVKNDLYSKVMYIYYLILQFLHQTTLSRNERNPLG